MTSKSSHKVRAIVLRSLDYGESDRILTFLTGEFGKLKGIAKGAKRSRRRFANALEPFSLSTILFSRKNRDGLAFIEASDVINHFAGIRVDLDRTLVAAYVAELADQFSVEGKKNLPLFELFTEFLGFIESGQMTEASERFFELRLLKSAGFEPVLDRCVTCQTPLENISTPRFDCREGGIRCARCTMNGQDFIPVSVGTLKTLLLGRDIDFEKMPRVGLSGPMARESREILGSFVRHLTGRELKALNVLGEIRRRYLKKEVGK